MGSLQDAVGQPLDAEIEARFQEILKRKVQGAVAAYVRAVRAIEAAYGQEGVEVIRRYDPPQPTTTSGDNSLRAYCQALEAGCRGSHEWEKLEDTADIGFWICEGDGPAAAAFNPAIRFSRTKTLMEGDDCCDHVYYVEEQQSNGD